MNNNSQINKFKKTLLNYLINLIFSLSRNSESIRLDFAYFPKKNAINFNIDDTNYKNGKGFDNIFISKL